MRGEAGEEEEPVVMAVGGEEKGLGANSSTSSSRPAVEVVRMAMTWRAARTTYQEQETEKTNKKHTINTFVCLYYMDKFHSHVFRF